MSDRHPQNPEEPDGVLVDRYLAGECTESESAVVRRYLMTHPEVAHRLRAFIERLDGDESSVAPSNAAPPSTDASWSRLHARLRDDGERAPAPAGATPHAAPSNDATLPTPPVSRRPSRRARWWTSPWSVGLSAGLAASMLLFVSLRVRVEQAERFNEAPRTYVTAARQRADLKLSDGTRVRVAPGSRLTVAAGFGEGRREVRLEGEAFFDVVHDSTRPFVVVAGTTVARDIGTSFSVRSYAQDSATQVVVRDGVVGVPEIGTLAAGDIGRVARDGRVTVRRRVNVDAMLRWVEGQLVFIDAPLGRVLQDIRRWYGVDVRVADPALESLPFTGALADVRSSTAVELVAVTLGLRVRTEGDRIVLEAVSGRTPRAAKRATRATDRT